MSHRPYPNADRALRQVTRRHGSDCPRCGHRDHAHPRSGGQYVCTRKQNRMPSCRECAERLLRLKAGPLGGLVESLSRVNVYMPNVTVSPGTAALPGGINVAVHEMTVDAMEAHRRGVVRIFQ
ncbi:hypothetical protein [Streptomyces californicus]|uniref:hypothetical protein n=1 Tax=Streptomyces californicus TaxID=67351 RepID=UPI0004C24E0A|nr:hypothetical protein [Streptomyces californicus]QRV59390.1 hypothetical protein I6J40_34590 [Streptomyces californicus]